MRRASVGVTTVSDAGSMHVRAWNVPPEDADKYAAAMTFWYGAPEEMISDVETMHARGLAAEAEGAAVFHVPGADGGDHG